MLPSEQALVLTLPLCMPNSPAHLSLSPGVLPCRLFHLPFFKSDSFLQLHKEVQELENASLHCAPPTMAMMGMASVVSQIVALRRDVGCMVQPQTCLNTPTQSTTAKTEPEYESLAPIYNSIKELWEEYTKGTHGRRPLKTLEVSPPHTHLAQASNGLHLRSYDTMHHPFACILGVPRSGL